MNRNYTVGLEREVFALYFALKAKVRLIPKRLILADVFPFILAALTSSLSFLHQLKTIHGVSFQRRDSTTVLFLPGRDHTWRQLSADDFQVLCLLVLLYISIYLPSLKGAILYATFM